MALGATAITAAAVGLPQGRSGQGRGGQGPDEFVAYLPPGEGQALVAKGCAGCHDFGGIVRLRAAAPKWEALVLDMGARGAPIDVDDVDPMVKYLSTVFGPDAPPLADVHSAPKTELVKLPGVTPEAADRLIAARTQGSLTTTEEVRAALGLDETAFAKIKYYLYLKSARPDRNR
jgi:hypothetical protein